MASTNPARGMRDFLPADVRKREYVIGIIKQVYESYGFEPLETPAVENLETLTGKYGEEGNQLIFKILKRGDKLAEVTKLRSYEGDEEASQLRNFETSQLSDLALRYDLTVPLARVVANNKNDLPKFFKRYQIQPVWRADRPARGRFREFYQCDVDVIGSQSMVVEAEIISAACEILDRLGFHDFTVRINHRDLLFGLLRKFAVPDEKHQLAITALDKIDKIGRTMVEKDFLAGGIDVDSTTKFLTALQYFVKHDRSVELTGSEKLATAEIAKLPDLLNESLERAIANMKRIYVDVDPDEIGIDLDYAVSALGHIAIAINQLRHLLQGIASGLSGLSSLEWIWHYLVPNPLVATRVVIDPTLARGLSYYTGTIMEINVDGIGSLGGGGRYDGLIGMFGKEQIPACGFSLGLERILVVMEERGMFPPEIADSTPADVMVTIWSEETISDSLKLANELRASGLRVTLYPEADKLGKQLKYADQIKVPFVCIVGPEEAEKGVVKLKNLRTGEEKLQTPAEIVTTIARSGK